MTCSLMSLCILLALITGPAFAQGDGETGPTDDIIGIYLDPEGHLDCVDGVPPGTSHFYVILKNLTSPGVGGFEMKIKADGDFTVSNITFPTPNYLEEGSREGEIIVWFCRPVMAEDRQAVVMEFDGHVQDGRPVTLFTRPIRYPSISGSPCYLDSENSRWVKALQPASGSVRAGVCFINAEHCETLTARSDFRDLSRSRNP